MGGLGRRVLGAACDKRKPERHRDPTATGNNSAAPVRRSLPCGTHSEHRRFLSLRSSHPGMHELPAGSEPAADPPDHFVHADARARVDGDNHRPSPDRAHSAHRDAPRPVAEYRPELPRQSCSRARSCGRPDARPALARVGRLYFPALLVALTGIVVWRWWQASRPARRILAPMLLPAGALCMAIAAQFTFGFIIGYLPAPPNIPPSVFTLLTNVANVAGIALPASFLLGMARANARHARVSRLILELSDLPPLDQLEQAMSRALGDPSLAVGRWDTEAERYVRASDGQVDPPLTDLPGRGTAEW